MKCKHRKPNGYCPKSKRFCLRKDERMGRAICQDFVDYNPLKKCPNIDVMLRHDEKLMKIIANSCRTEMLRKVNEI